MEISWLLLAAFLPRLGALDNGLALRPPMGWISWVPRFPHPYPIGSNWASGHQAAFYCEIDCQRHPLTCISEQLYAQMAEALVDGGSLPPLCHSDPFELRRDLRYREAGYKSINIDDCWSEKARDGRTGRLVADRRRFPSGIPSLANFVSADSPLYASYPLWLAPFGLTRSGG